MKFTIDRKQLKAAIDAVEHIAPVKSHKPVIQCVKVEVEPRRVLLTATDLETSIVKVVDGAEIAEQGVALFNAKELKKLLGKVKVERVTVSTDDKGGRVEAGKVSFHLETGDIEEFPVPSFQTDGISLSFGAELFQDALKKTLFAVAREKTHYALNGLLMESNGDFNLAATDGRRMSTYRIETKLSSNSPEYREVIPCKAAIELCNNLKDIPEIKIRVNPNDHVAVFYTNDFAISTRLVEGRFPDYQSVIPEYNGEGKQFTFNGKALCQALDEVCVMGAGSVKIDLMDNNLHLRAWDGENGRMTAEADFPIEYAGGEGSIGLNPAYLKDFLKSIGDKAVVGIINNENEPALFTVGNYRHVLMPVSTL